MTFFENFKNGEKPYYELWPMVLLKQPERLWILLTNRYLGEMATLPFLLNSYKLFFDLSSIPSQASPVVCQDNLCEIFLCQCPS